MALWAIPRVDPWLDLLCESFNCVESEKRRTAIDFLRVPWWATVPWLAKQEEASSPSLQEILWNSAVGALRCETISQQDKAENLLERIAEDVLRGLDPKQLSGLHEWVAETKKVLRGYNRVDLGNWHLAPVGKAIQLTLLRHDPSTFAKWRDDFSSMPPSLWWSGAVYVDCRTATIDYRPDSEVIWNNSVSFLFIRWAFRTTPFRICGRVLTNTVLVGDVSVERLFSRGPALRSPVRPRMLEVNGSALSLPTLRL